MIESLMTRAYSVISCLTRTKVLKLFKPCFETSIKMLSKYFAKKLSFNWGKAFDKQNFKTPQVCQQIEKYLEHQKVTFNAFKQSQLLQSVSKPTLEPPSFKFILELCLSL